MEETLDSKPNGRAARTITYHAKASFDVETELLVSTDDYKDRLSLWLAIIGDLETRYGLEITCRDEEGKQLFP